MMWGTGKQDSHREDNFDYHEKIHNCSLVLSLLAMTLQNFSCKDIDGY